jgi:hypothetical protein
MSACGDMNFRAFLTDARFERFYDHWQALRGDRPMPVRRELDPADIKDLLPHIVIVAVDGPRFLFRLVGTEVVNRIGVDNTGRHLDELEPSRGFRDFAARVFETVRNRRAAVLAETDFEAGAANKGVRRLSLPFSDNGTDVSHIVSLMLFSWPKGAAPLIVRDEVEEPRVHRIAAVDNAA